MQRTVFILWITITHSLLASTVFGQVVNVGQLEIQSGTSFTTSTSVVNNAAATVTTNGTLDASGDVTNQATATMTGIEQPCFPPCFMPPAYLRVKVLFRIHVLVS